MSDEAHDPFNPESEMSKKDLMIRVLEMERTIKGVVVAVAEDLHRLNILLYTHLKEEGKAIDLVCSECEAEFVKPLLDGLDQDESCPACGFDFNGVYSLPSEGGEEE